jgi:hypothetical protein
MSHSLQLRVGPVQGLRGIFLSLLVLFDEIPFAEEFGKEPFGLQSLPFLLLLVVQIG